ncbi:MAG TPA: twin-arginine translocase TatA/TatE family subunit [Candidatus Limnocylindrales bacterium]|nr:twin-arginine translocase TatA/TatE family subunit [Candidatus Limnocylindrales bacterium]
MPSFGPEWIIVLIVALLVLGPKRLPEVGSALGKTIREFRQGLNEAKDAAGLEAGTPPAQPATPPAPSTAGPPAPSTADQPTGQAAQPPAPAQPQTVGAEAALAAAAGTELRAAALPAPPVPDGGGPNVGHQPGPAA